MYRRTFALILAVGIGVGIGALTVSRLASDDPSVEGLPEHTTGSLVERLTQGQSSELDPQQLALVLESLIQTLDEEISERRALEEQLEEVRSELAELQQNLDARVEDTASQQPEAQVDPTVEDRLAAAGFTLQQIEAIRRREAELQMRWVELDDQARREGWINTPRYFGEINNLTSGTNTLRRDLGDDAYDRYLFASGRPNRITVGTVFETSPAEQAGIQVGDVIRSFGGERVFSMEQLNNLRSAGEKGSPAIVEIIRNGQRMQITMPRGPMGVQMQSEVVDPTD